MSGPMLEDPAVEIRRTAALDVVANTLTSVVLRLNLALTQLTAADLPPEAQAAAALLEGLPERLVGLGPDLTRMVAGLVPAEQERVAGATGQGPSGPPSSAPGGRLTRPGSNELVGAWRNPLSDPLRATAAGATVVRTSAYAAGPTGASAADLAVVDR